MTLVDASNDLTPKQGVCKSASKGKLTFVRIRQFWETVNSGHCVHCVDGSTGGGEGIGSGNDGGIA